VIKLTLTAKQNKETGTDEAMVDLIERLAAAGISVVGLTLALEVAEVDLDDVLARIDIATADREIGTDIEMKIEIKRALLRRRSDTSERPMEAALRLVRV
jgi:hypothetical protein